MRGKREKIELDRWGKIIFGRRRQEMGEKGEERQLCLFNEYQSIRMMDPKSLSTLSEIIKFTILKPKFFINVIRIILNYYPRFPKL